MRRHPYFLVWLIWALVGVALVVSLSAQAQQKEKEKVANAKVALKLTDIYTAIYQAVEDGEVFSTLMNEEEYAGLAMADAVPPQLDLLPKGKTWEFVSAAKNDFYNTQSGNLEPGDVYLLSATEALVFLPDEAAVSVDLRTHEVIVDSVKGISIVPDPPGLAVKDGELFKEKNEPGPPLDEMPGGGVTP
jgi:hypothetical protein